MDTKPTLYPGGPPLDFVAAVIDPLARQGAEIAMGKIENERLAREARIYRELVEELCLLIHQGENVTDAKMPEGADPDDVEAVQISLEWLTTARQSPRLAELVYSCGARPVSRPLPITRAEILAGWARLEAETRARGQSLSGADMIAAHRRNEERQRLLAERARTFEAENPPKVAPGPDGPIIVGIAWAFGLTAALCLALVVVWCLVMAWESMDRQTAGYVAFAVICAAVVIGRVRRGRK